MSSGYTGSMATVEEVLTLVRQLSPEEREDLLDRLFVEEDEVPDFDPDYRRELQRRVREYESGATTGIPWEDVRKEVWQRLGIPD